MRFAFLFLAALLLPAEEPATVRLVEWERGIAVQPQARPELTMYFWFYEWNMFEAMSPGQHTRGSWNFPKTIARDQATAVLGPPALRLTARAVHGGADLSLRATNLSAHDWPELAGIVPCWSPGQLQAGGAMKPPSFFGAPRTPQFADNERSRTYFLSPNGLAGLASRAIHFSGALRARIEAASEGGQFTFSYKWPTSDVNAEAGILIRESADGEWVTGIGWSGFLSVQGHNPWNCMHVCVRAGPLKRKESKTVRGRLYLFRGSKEDCLARFAADMGLARAPREMAPAGRRARGAP